MAAEHTMTFVGEPDVNRMFQALAMLIGTNAGVELTAMTVRQKTPDEVLKDKESGRAALLEVGR